MVKRLLVAKNINQWRICHKVSDVLPLEMTSAYALMILIFRKCSYSQIINSFPATCFSQTKSLATKQLKHHITESSSCPTWT